MFSILLTFSGSDVCFVVCGGWRISLHHERRLGTVSVPQFCLDTNPSRLYVHKTRTIVDAVGFAPSCGSSNVMTIRRAFKLEPGVGVTTHLTRMGAVGWMPERGAVSTAACFRKLLTSVWLARRSSCFSGAVIVATRSSLFLDELVQQTSLQESRQLAMYQCGTRQLSPQLFHPPCTDALEVHAGQNQQSPDPIVTAHPVFFQVDPFDNHNASAAAVDDDDSCL